MLGILLLSILILEPSAVVEKGGSVDLGAIGPGQTISMKIEPKVSEGGIYGEGGVFDYAVVEELPPGWKGKNSKLYERPLYVSITAAHTAEEGQYQARVKLVDEFNGERLGNFTFNVKIRVSKDVMDAEISPERITTSPGQPAVFTIIVENKGAAGDVFEIGAEGPKRWSFKKFIYVAPKQKKVVRYEVVGEEEEVYKAKIYVKSTASEEIKRAKEVEIEVRPTLEGDIKASANGIMIYPFFNLPLQALNSFLSIFLNA